LSVIFHHLFHAQTSAVHFGAKAVADKHTQAHVCLKYSS